MLKVVTAKEMQELDRLTIDKYGIAGTILMERAGLAVAEKINELFFQNIKYRGQGSGVSLRPMGGQGSSRHFLESYRAEFIQS